MSYEKETWATGDTITAAKLNNMEDGIANVDPFIITITEEGVIASTDKTWREIDTAFKAGRTCVLIWDSESEWQSQTYIDHKVGCIVAVNSYGTVGGEDTSYSAYLCLGSNIEGWSVVDGPDSPIYYSYD